MVFWNKVSYMVKILTFQIIMTRTCIMSGKCHKIWYLNCTISFESYATLMRVRYTKSIIINKVRAIEQICVLDPGNENFFGMTTIMFIKAGIYILVPQQK